MARKNIEESENQFRALAESIPQLAWMADASGWIYWYNKQWYEYTGTNSKDMEGWGWQSVHDPDELPKVLKKWEYSISTGNSFDMVFPIRSATCEFRSFLTRVNPVYDTRGKISKWFGTNTDITEQLKLAEHSKFLSNATRTLITDIDYEARLQRIADLLVPSFADWCVVDLVNEDNCFEAVAMAHKDSSRVDLIKELRQKYPSKSDALQGIVHVIKTQKPELVPDISDEVLKAAAHDEEHYKILSDLNLKSYICVPLLFKEKALGALTVISAESKRRFSEDDLVLMTQVADRAALAITNAKLFRDATAAIKVRDDFLSIASHELKTPITSLRMQLQIAQKSMNPATGIKSSPEKLTRTIDVSLKQVDRITKMVEDLLDISRIEAGKMSFDFQTVDLGQIIREATERFRVDLNAANCPVEFEAIGSSYVECDPFRIEQVILNLLSNAAKYGSGKPVHILVEVTDTMAKISVQDRGIGIPHEDQAKIFERFERAVSHLNISGWGLGLYITKRIVDAHQGRIIVKSEPDEGSTFTVELPLTQEIK